MSALYYRRPMLLDMSDAVGRKKGGGGESSVKGAKAASPKQSQGSPMMMDKDPSTEILDSLKEKLAYSMERFKKDLSGISAGRASPELLAKITVETYDGESEVLSKVAQVALKDHQTLMVNVFDPNLVKSVADAISNAGMQLNPQVTGSSVRVLVPRITQEYRESLVKKVSELSELAKKIMRSHRHDLLKASQKNKDAFSKDELFKLEENLTKLTNEAVKQVTTEQERKAKDLLKSQ